MIENVVYRINEETERSMLRWAKIVDALSFVPALNFVTSLAVLIFYLWFKEFGVNTFEERRRWRNILGAIAEVIPFASMIPTFYFNVKKTIKESREEDEKNAPVAARRQGFRARQKAPTEDPSAKDPRRLSYRERFLTRRSR